MQVLAQVAQLPSRAPPSRIDQHDMLCTLNLVRKQCLSREPSIMAAQQIACHLSWAPPLLRVAQQPITCPLPLAPLLRTAQQSLSVRLLRVVRRLSRAQPLPRTALRGKHSSAPTLSWCHTEVICLDLNGGWHRNAPYLRTMKEQLPGQRATGLHDSRSLERDREQKSRLGDHNVPRGLLPRGPIRWGKEIRRPSSATTR
jgi:hypothetical protein